MPVFSAALASMPCSGIDVCPVSNAHLLCDLARQVGHEEARAWRVPVAISVHGTLHATDRHSKMPVIAASRAPSLSTSEPAVLATAAVAGGFWSGCPRELWLAALVD